MTTLPNPTVDAIYATYKDDARRGYLGGSQIGDECTRKLWMLFRWAGREVFDGRMLRLFDTGKREEERVIAELRAAGITVYDKDANGKQWRYTECDGHLSGGLDGVVEGLAESSKPHLLEVKTANDKSYKAIEKNGCEKEKPVHYAQQQLYMGLAGLTRSLYLVVNKNTDEILTERIEFHPAAYKALLLKARGIICAESAPDKTESFRCKFCPVAGLCHGMVAPEVNCRTCCHSSPVKDGKWACAKGLPMEPECTEHLFIPSLLPWATPLDGTPEWILYKRNSDGSRFVMVSGTGFPAIDVEHVSSYTVASVMLVPF